MVSLARMTGGGSAGILNSTSLGFSLVDLPSSPSSSSESLSNATNERRVEIMPSAKGTRFDKFESGALENCF